MTERGSDTAELDRARADVAERDARISDMECAHRRLQYLHDITKLLLRFEHLEQTVPEVIDVVAQTLPLRSALFILETAGSPRTIAWHAEDETAERIQMARAQAQAAYNYLIHSRVELGRHEATILELPRLPADAPKVEVDGRKTF